MKKYIQKKSVLFILLLVGTLALETNAQVLIEPFDGPGAPPRPSASVCQTITVGTTFEFQQGMNCDDDLVLSFYLNDSQVEAGTSEFDLIRNGSFNYTFEQLGLYSFFCGAPSTDLAAGSSEICYNVVAVQDIPTLGEWGLIILFVALLIFGLVMIRQSATKGLKIQ